MFSMQRIFLNLAILIFVACSTILIVPQTTYADCPNDKSSAGYVLDGVGHTGKCTEGGVTKTVTAIVEILSYVAGAAAIIMVIVAGFKYITSGGDSGRVSSAKNTLIYALIGLAITVLAQLLVHFVLNAANAASKNGMIRPSPTSIIRQDA